MKIALNFTNKLKKKDSWVIGIITDIHGNDVALKETLNDLKDCDYIISIGDLVGIGPNSNEVLDIVRNVNNFYTVLGNHERYLLYGFNNPLSCLTLNQQKFTEDSISEINKEYIRTIPKEIVFEWKNKTFCFLHYARRKYRGRRFKLIDHNPTYEKLVDLFEFHKQDYIIYGHEHKGSVIENGNADTRYFINPGSTGCPCPNKDELRYAKLYLGDKIDFEVITKKYDSSSVVKAMIDKDMPNKELIIKDFYKYS